MIWRRKPIKWKVISVDFFFNLLTALQSSKSVFDFCRDFASILIKRYTLCDLDPSICDENLFQTEFYFEIHWEFHQISAC